VLRQGAAIALGESRWPGARPVLEQHLQARERRLREACRAALRALQENPRGGTPATSSGGGDAAAVAVPRDAGAMGNIDDA
jgi:hypothetical protein